MARREEEMAGEGVLKFLVIYPGTDLDRRELSEKLFAEGDFTVAVWASNPEELSEILQRKPVVDTILMDARFSHPSLGEEHYWEAVRAVYPGVPTIVISAYHHCRWAVWNIEPQRVEKDKWPELIRGALQKQTAV